MSRQAQLPPRCPLQRKPRPQAPQSFATPSQFEFRPQHHRSSSLGSISDEQPAWLDDLLNDSKGLSHRRSASDSVALSDASVDNLQPPTTHSDEVSSISPDSTGLDSACLYGPSSPRKKGNPSFSDNAIVSILSEYVSQSPLKSADGSVHISRFTGFGMTKDEEGSAAELNAKIEIVKRHSGQRSRVRKLQYIAELESTVNALQTMESDLAIRVRSLLQQRLALSLEKSKLKQQVARLQQEKFILDGEYLHLKRDFEILKSVLPEGSTSKLRAQFGSAIAAEHPETAWNLLDMGKLNLN